MQRSFASTLHLQDSLYSPEDYKLVFYRVCNDEVYKLPWEYIWHGGTFTFCIYLKVASWVIPAAKIFGPGSAVIL